MIERYRPREAATVSSGVETETETGTGTGTPAPARKKVRGRPFQPGNPGRPPGAKNHTTRLLEQFVDGKAEKLTQKGVELALAGNVRCVQLFLDRLLPRRNGRPVDFSLPAVSGAQDLVTASAGIIAGVSDGSLTTEEASQLMQVLERSAKLFETHDLASRLAALESKLDKKP